VKIDNKKEESGTLEADWDFLAPKKIKVEYILLKNLIFCG
jgi:hypothetical protein